MNEPSAPPPVPSTSPEPPPLAPEFSRAPDLKTLLELLLQQPRSFAHYLSADRQATLGKLVSITLLGWCVFGFVLGCFAKHEQLWAAPLKLMLGLLLSSVICFPSLYIFSLLAGAKLSASDLVTHFSAALALAGLLLVALAPALWIFAESTDSLGFMGTLAVGSWLIALAFARRFLHFSLLGASGIGQGPLRAWAAIFLLVTLQMSTSLRPVLDRSPVLLSGEKRFFLAHWINTFGSSLLPPMASAAKEHEDAMLDQH